MNGLARCVLIALLAAVLGACASGPADTHADAQADAQAHTQADARAEELANTERAFAASASPSIRAAFLAVLADDATLFRPGPVDGRTFTEAHPDGTFTLAWQPQRVAVAASGELGYSTGPYRLTAAADPAHPLNGQYFTIWRRGADGRWQVLFDHGNAHDDPVGWSAPFEAIGGDGTSATSSLAEAEAAFARRSATSGVADAYRVLGSTHLRLLRDDAVPLDGIAAAAKMPAATASWTWTVGRSGTSRAGDLGWTTGEYREATPAAAADAGPASRGYFVRVWIVEARAWKILGDVLATIDDPIH